MLHRLLLHPMDFHVPDNLESDAAFLPDEAQESEVLRVDIVTTAGVLFRDGQQSIKCFSIDQVLLDV